MPVWPTGQRRPSRRAVATCSVVCVAAERSCGLTRCIETAASLSTPWFFQTSLKYAEVKRYDEWFVTRLLVVDGRVHGGSRGRAADRADPPGRPKVVVLCTGGCGKVFPFTTSTNIKTGDGMALASRGVVRVGWRGTQATSLTLEQVMDNRHAVRTCGVVMACAVPDRMDNSSRSST